MSTVQKQVVRFGRGALVKVNYGKNAHLLNVTGHPRLGDMPEVFTSRIESVDFSADGEIERVVTLNTIYVREDVPL